MILNTAAKLLSVFLAAPVTTNELDIVVSFNEGVSDSPGLIFSTNEFVTTGTTKVAILSPPEATERRIVDFLSIHNNDTVAAIVTLQIEDTLAVTDHVIIKVTLQLGDSLIYKKEEGFEVIDSNGGIKAVVAAPFAAPSQSVDIGDSGVEGVATTHSRSDHQHPFPAPLAGYPENVKVIEEDGVATTPARSDHVHLGLIPQQILARISLRG